MTTSRTKKTKREGRKADAKTFPHPRFNIPKDPPLNTDPVAIPAGYGKPRSLQEMMAAMIRDYVEMEKDGEEYESWDEANDFEPDEEEGLLEMSPYTFTDLPEDDPETPSEAPQEDNSSPPNPDAVEMKASQEATEAGLEPQRS